MVVLYAPGPLVFWKSFCVGVNLCQKQHSTLQRLISPLPLVHIRSPSTTSQPVQPESWRLNVKTEIWLLTDHHIWIFFFKLWSFVVEIYTDVSSPPGFSEWSCFFFVSLRRVRSWRFLQPELLSRGLRPGKPLPTVLWWVGSRAPSRNWLQRKSGVGSVRSPKHKLQQHPDSTRSPCTGQHPSRSTSTCRYDTLTRCLCPERPEGKQPAVFYVGAPELMLSDNKMMLKEPQFMNKIAY